MFFASSPVASYCHWPFIDRCVPGSVRVARDPSESVTTMRLGGLYPVRWAKSAWHTDEVLRILQGKVHLSLAAKMGHKHRGDYGQDSIGESDEDARIV